MSSRPWMRFLGLPYRLGADPLKGRATDCVHLTFRTQELDGVKIPPIKREWYHALCRKDISPLMQDWYDLTTQTQGPEQHAMTVLSRNPEFSLAVVIDGGLLSIRENTGAIWTPLSSLRPMNYRRFQ
jgi:hypothetical protein